VPPIQLVQGLLGYASLVPTQPQEAIIQNIITSFLSHKSFEIRDFILDIPKMNDYTKLSKEIEP